jgi:hypothetical protein
MNTHEYNIQVLWDTIKSLNIKIYRIEEGAEIQTKGCETYLMKL